MIHMKTPESDDSFDSFDPSDRYAQYAEDQEQPRGRRSSKEKKKPAKARDADGAELKQVNGELQIATTYEPSRHEATWLLQSLDQFFREQVITDILFHVKGGKEASVYCCQAHSSTGYELVAAKVYRPKQFRSMRNDALYREGRALITAQGRAMMEERGRQTQRPDRRTMRAVASKSAFGQSVLHTSWLSYEFAFMEQMFRAGGAVPAPVACGENAVIMSFVGDLQGAAPTLNSVQLNREQAKRMLATTLENIELMLRHGFIHGDLSAYNLLYWQDDVMLIDFPQVSDAHANPHAEAMLTRDLERICDYFGRMGAPANPRALAIDLWEQFLRNEA
ncbi:MAG: hypothetical protein OHK0050_35800 [Roseiflexaceae bacterium]